MLVSSCVQETKLGRERRTIKRVRINGIVGIRSEKTISIILVKLITFQYLISNGTSIVPRETEIYHLLAVSLHSVVQLRGNRGRKSFYSQLKFYGNEHRTFAIKKNWRRYFLSSCLLILTLPRSTNHRIDTVSY